MAELTIEQRRSIELAKAKAKAAATKNRGNNPLGHFNKALAETAGGMVDFINPFDEYTGSAATGLKRGMEAVGVPLPEGDPETLWQNFGAGAGKGAAAILPVVKGLQALTSVGGAVGAFADDAIKALSSWGGVTAETVAAGTGAMAREGAKRAGAPEWAQGLAEIAVPALALPTGIKALETTKRGAYAAARSLPVSGYAIRAAQGIAKGIAPMSESGARGVARDELFRRVGGEQRARELGGQIDPNDPLGMTPAQQTGDPELLAMENAAKNENALVREALESRATQTRATAAGAIADEGGNVVDARKFFSSRVKEHSASMAARVDRVIATANANTPIGRGTETGQSGRVVETLQLELTDALGQERALWGAVDRNAVVPTDSARAAAKQWADEMGKVGADNIPAKVSRFLLGDDAFTGETSVREMHRLYSDLREVARNAMAGTSKQKTLATIANNVADAILEDLGAVPASTAVGQQINEARAFSRALHETFDQGAVGRILRRTVDGDEAIDPAVALKRTVGRGGADAVAASDDILRAAPGARGDIEAYLRDRFADTILSPEGKFNRNAAAKYLRANAEVLARFPNLQRDFRRAMSDQKFAESFAARAKLRASLADQSPAARFADGLAERAIFSIIKADDPIAAAKSVAATARKDKTGAALAGVKGAFTDYLIRGASKDGVLSGKELAALMGDRSLRSAMREVFSPAEWGRLDKIAHSMARMDGKAAATGEVLNTPANTIIDTVVRIAAARVGGDLGSSGGMGGSLQTANIFVARARNYLRNITNDRARQLLVDAVSDAELMKSLLTDPRSIADLRRFERSIAPYVAGAAANIGEDN